MPAFHVAPTPGPYDRARLAARSAAGGLAADAAQRIERALRDEAERIAQQLARLPVSPGAAPTRRALEHARRIALDAAQRLHGEIETAVAANRRLAFDRTLAVWQEATRQAVGAAIPGALRGAVAVPNLTTAGMYEALGGAARTWKTALATYAEDSYRDLDDIMRAGLMANVSPSELARRLRPYVQGAQSFDQAFPARDERMKALRDHRALAPGLRDAAYKVRVNSLRIAYTETHNARAEAEVQAFATDPVVGAVRWELSPYRGTQATADVCDALANNDWYGLGAGVYPIDAVPLSPHPRDRCERVPVARPPDQWAQPKPAQMKRQLPPAKAKVGGAGVTQQQADRIRTQLRHGFLTLDQHSRTDAVRALMALGERQGAELAAAVAERQADIARLLAAGERAVTPTPATASSPAPAAAPTTAAPPSPAQRGLRGEPFSGVPARDLPAYTKASQMPTPAGYVRSELGHGGHTVANLLTRRYAGLELTAAEEEAIDTYTGDAFAAINAQLRLGQPFTPEQRRVVSALTRAARHRTLGHDVILYRGLGNNHPLAKVLAEEGWDALRSHVGDVLVEPGFMSTTATQSVAMGDFSGVDRVLLEIRAPASTEGLYLGHMGQFGSYAGATGEEEVLLPPGQKYRIVEVREENNGGVKGRPRVRIIVELVP